ncbi:MAG: hypothetical protein IPF73_19575 [Betaproteobacteria bacterium]|nr:hypothetical protein [Betaproteobacteria bacterium]
MDLGDTNSGTRELTVGGAGLPADVSARATYDLKGWAWTIAGTYRLARPALTMDVLGGVRMLDIETTLGWSSPAASTASRPRAARVGGIEPHEVGLDHRREGPLRVRRRPALVRALLPRRQDR